MKERLISTNKQVDNKPIKRVSPVIDEESDTFKTDEDFFDLDEI